MKNPGTDQFKLIFESTPAPYLILEPDAPRFTIKAVNNAYLTITNTVRDAIVGRPLFEVFPDNPNDPDPTGVANLTSSLMKVLETKKAHEMATQRYDIPIPGKEDFELRYWTPQNVPVLNEDGEIVSIVHSVFDITEKVLLEKEQKVVLEQLTKANSDLSKSNEELERFAFIVSHDLQEPIRKINTFGNLVKKRLSQGINKEEIDFVNRLLSAADRVRTLVADVLAYYITPYSNENFDIVDLNVVIKEVLQNMDDIIREKKATVAVDKLYPIKGDARQLRQMFQNLLSNSLKFSKPGLNPHITISSKLVSSGSKITELPEKEKYEQIEFQDNGIGFEPEYEEKIFEVFERLHGYEDYPGSGIGLSVVKKIIENHHGNISSKGALNNGATFKILLPVEQVEY